MRPALYPILFRRTLLQWTSEMLADVAVIGDSRGQDGLRRWKNLSAANWDGMPTSGGFCVVGITDDANGNSTLEYRASDKHLRWTAPDDTAGEWTQAFAGRNVLASATPGYEVDVAITSYTGLPGTDKTISTNTTGTIANGHRAYGPAPRALSQLRWLKRTYQMLAVGGATSSGVVEMLAWLEAEAGGPGVDIFILGTNDISGSVASATIIANLQAIYDARIALDRRLVIVGETARWGVNGSTPMNATQIGIFDDVRTFQQGYAAAHPSDVEFIDTYPLTYDSGQTDRRPATGMLRDHVHPSNQGAQVVGAAIASALRARGCAGTDISAADTDNLFANGYINGSGGSVGTGCTGTMPTGWVSARQNSNVSCATSIVARDDGYGGSALKIEAAASGGAGYALIEASTLSLATLGLSVGDTVHLEFSVSVRGASGLNYVRPQIYQLGLSPSVIMEALDPGGSNYHGDEDALFVTPPVAIQTGCTGLKIYFFVACADGGSAEVRLNACKVVETP